MPIDMRRIYDAQKFIFSVAGYLALGIGINLAVGFAVVYVFFSVLGFTISKPEPETEKNEAEKVLQKEFDKCQKLDSKLTEISELLRALDQDVVRRFEKVRDVITPENCKAFARLKWQSVDPQRRDEGPAKQ